MKQKNIRKSHLLCCLAAVLFLSACGGQTASKAQPPDSASTVDTTSGIVSSKIYNMETLPASSLESGADTADESGASKPKEDDGRVSDLQQGGGLSDAASDADPEDVARRVLEQAIAGKLQNGFALMPTGEETVEGEHCYTFAFGSNMNEKFTAETHYAVSDSGMVYVYDILAGGVYAPLAQTEP